MQENKPYSGIIPIYYHNDVNIKGQEVYWRVLVKDRDFAVRLFKKVHAVIEKELDEIKRGRDKDI